ncbi:MMPL family transporter (plasmid) [Streptomyces yangpuensis]|uniref:MMPL family transporter n=1 Tax=Streptomyces yangpuensis TaxID=1648182 RepID=A0ABY5Q8K8_9ACTN|nr:MMPL family transporter [Streptomyces yangpuensis]UUY52502.1 MMPL family transporter [Streptomyces yangpuensis]
MKTIRGLATAPAGRWGKWLFLAAWLIIAVALAPLAGKLADVKDTSPNAALPRNAESAAVNTALERFQQGNAPMPAVAVYTRSGTLTEADRAKAEADRAAFARYAVKGTQVSAPEPSKDGKALIVIVPLSADDMDTQNEQVEQIRRIAATGAPAGLTAEVGGPAGAQADFTGVFANLDANLMAATGSVVIILLLLIYRSPVLWLFPMLSVGFAAVLTQATTYLLAKHASLPVDAASASVLMVLVFGVGTDYALLLISRYREELFVEPDRHVAMRTAVMRSGPAIVASAATVAVGLACLGLADLKSSRSLGLVGAVGILCTLVAMMTVLPALLVIAGRWVFFPLIPKHGRTPRGGRMSAAIGNAVARRPRRAWIVSVLVTGGLAAGALTIDMGLTPAENFQDKPESIVAQEKLAAHFPSGASDPTTVVASAAHEQKVRDAARIEGVADIGPSTLSPDKALVSLPVVLKATPNSPEANDTIDALRTAVHAVPEANALVGGRTAQTLDVQRATDSDLRKITPVVLGVILLVLVLLLRSLVAPILLLLTVVLSYATALGASNLLFEHVLGYAGVDWTIPLVGFVFLVALGVDYNIFLMHRIREETEELGHRQGILAGLTKTGGVITSAGVVLAATFAVFAVMPLVSMAQMGIVVGIGILIDTFLIRTILVPALGLDIGRAIWWPSGLFRRLGDTSQQAVTSPRVTAPRREETRV